MRYEVREVPFGNTPHPDINARFTVVDLRPECETFETRMGGELVEDKPPAWRNVAFCMKRGHAEMICGALNNDCTYSFVRDAEMLGLEVGKTTIKSGTPFLIYDEASEVPSRVWDFEQGKWKSNV